MFISPVVSYFHSIVELAVFYLLVVSHHHLEGSLGCHLCHEKTQIDWNRLNWMNVRKFALCNYYLSVSIVDVSTFYYVLVTSMKILTHGVTHVSQSMSTLQFLFPRLLSSSDIYWYARQWVDLEPFPVDNEQRMQPSPHHCRLEINLN